MIYLKVLSKAVLNKILSEILCKTIIEKFEFRIVFKI